ncbi:MAG TPA: hypothetical protein VHW25_17600 [Steroidobacteraceae bacterium]|jgi:hypothetical protein|nr:hypothetical protein [Steroidobacteraceae bacterium]
MDIRKSPITAVAVGVTIAASLGLAGCASVAKHLPWGHKAPPVPEVSTALTVAAPDGATLSWPQVWQRNDVVLDMAGVAATGSAVVMPRSGVAWPVRVALRVVPGSIGSIDVRGAQRLVIPVPASGTGTIDLELPPGVYVAATKQITLNWGPASVPSAN